MATSKELYNELAEQLPKSYSIQREAWARKIINEQIDILELAELFKHSLKVAMRFSWLLSDVGMENPEYLKKYLPDLFKLRNDKLQLELPPQFAKYWNICGIPEENEGEAVNLLFNLLQSNQYKLHFKHSAIKCLLRVIEKYPELKEELRILVEHQLETDTTENFKKWCHKLLNQKKLWN